MRAKLNPIYLLWLGMMLFPFGDCFAQNLNLIQNKVAVTYSDSVHQNYGTESNIVTTPCEKIITNVRVIPPQATVKAGGTFSLGIAVESVHNLFGFQFDLVYAPNILEVISVTEGTFLNKDGVSTFWVAPDTITIPGKIDNNGDTRIGTNTGVSGTGTLAVVQFKAKGIGTSAIDLQEVKLVNNALSVIPANVFAGTVSVTGNIEGFGAHAEDVVYNPDFEGLLPPGVDKKDTVVISLNVVDTDTDPTTGYVDVTFNIPSEADVSAIRAFKYSGTTTECLKVTGSLPVTRPGDGIPRFIVDSINMKVTIRVFVGDPQIALIIPSASFVDLWVTKVGPAEVLPGGIATYTVTYGNRGNATATDVALSDQFPQEMDYVVRNEAGYILVRQVSTNHGTWSIPSVAPGTYTFALSIQIKGDATPGTVTNTMRIEYPGAETDNSNNNATCTITIPIPDIDLWVTKQGPSEVQPGEVATYTVTYGNRGNATATDVALSDQFPSQMDYVVRNEAGYILVRHVASNHGTWSIPSVAPGTYSFALSIMIKGSATPGSVINTMRIEYPGAETDYTNNNATCTMTIPTPQIDLWVTKQGPAEVQPGGIATYTVTYGNQGNATATDVALSDQFPSQMDYVVRNEAGYILVRHVASNHGTWSIPSVAPGTYSFALSIMIKGSATPGSVINTMRIEYPGAETDDSNNNATCTMTIPTLQIDLWVTKQGPAEVQPGGIATYTVTYGNRGNATATDIALSDQFPSQMDYVVRNEAGYILVRHVASNHGTWSIPSVAPGTYSFALSIMIKGSATPGSVINTMRIEYPGAETDYTNNNATCTMTIPIPNIDLWVTKSGPAEVQPGGIATYTVTYGNRGNATATDVALSDQFPSQMDYVVRNEAGYILVRHVASNHGTWSIPSVAPGTYSFALSIMIKGSATPGSVINTMRIEYPGAETDYTNNNATCTMTIPTPQIDLWVIKTGPAEVQPGGIATYTVTYGNRGNATATDVALSDQFPQEMDYVVRNEAGYILVRQVSTNHGTWSIPSVAPGTYSFALSIQIKGDATPGTVTNTMRIEYPGAETDNSNNNATCTITIPIPDIDLWVTKTGPAQVQPGGIATYTVTYGNRGNATATDVALSDQFPQEMDYVVRNEAGYILVRQVSTNHGTWSIPSVAPGTYTFALSIQIKGDATPGTVTNTMRIEYPGAETDNSNNNATCTITIPIPDIDLWVTKTGPAQVQPGGIATYTVTYGNQGNATATDVALSDQFPSQMDYVVRNEAGYILVRHVASNHGTWSIPSVAPGTYSFALSIMIKGSATPGTVINTMRIECPGAETDYTNNNATCTMTIPTPQIDLWVTKSGPAEIQPGGIATYTVTYGNQGNATATDVALSDQFPSQMDYVVRNETGYILVRQVSTNHGTWSIPSVAPGTYSFALSIQIKGDAAPGTVTNTMRIEYPGAETDYTNNNATCTMTIPIPNIDLWVTKSGPAEVQPGGIATYTVTYGNRGNATATDVALSDQFPSQMDYVVRNEAGYILVRHVASNHGTWSIPSVAPGTYSFALSIMIKGSATPGSVINTMRIEYPGAETDDSNNNATCTMTIPTPQIDLWVTKQGPAEVQPGGIATYTVTYGNRGNATATDVALSDQFPSQMDYVVRNEAGYILVRHVASNHGTWSIPSVAPGTYSFALSIMIKGSATPGSVINTMRIEYPGAETDYTNNNATCTMTIPTPQIDLWVTKQGPAEVQPGEVATYTVTYGNRGNATATDVALSDQFPSQMDYVVRNEAGYILVRQVSTNHGTWSIPSVPPGTSTFALSIQIKGDAIPGTVTNTMRIEYPGAETDNSNNNATCTMTIPTSNIDLWVTKTGPVEIQPGEIATYTVTYGNRGNATAENVKLSDQFPSQMDYIVRNEAGYILVRQVSSNHGTWSIPSVAPGTYTFALSIQIREDATPGTVINTMRIEYSGAETNSSNNNATCTITIPIPNIDLWVTKTGPAQVQPGEIATYTVTYGNRGNATAENVKLSDQFPSQMDYIVRNEAGYILVRQVSSNHGTWSIPSVAPGTYTFALSIQIREDATPGTVINTMRIEYSGAETNSSNNNATCTITIPIPNIDLWVTKTGPAEVQPGGIATYTVTYGNRGNATAENVKLSDQFPSQMDYIVRNEAGYILVRQVSSNHGTWSISAVPPGTYTFKLSIRIREDALPGTVTNTMRIEYPGSELNYTNNDATCTITIPIPNIDLWVTKTGPAEVQPGGIATYTVTYGNRGNATAEGVKLSDQFPSQMDYVVRNEAGYILVRQVSSNHGTWSIPSVAPGTYTFALSIQIKGDATPGTVTNTMRIEYPGAETNSSNNNATCTITIPIPNIDLWVTKTGPAEIQPGEIATYTVTYGNRGNATAENVKLSDQFPSQMDYVVRNEAGYILVRQVSTNHGTWSIPSVPPGTSTPFKLSIQIKGDASPGTVTNTMRIEYPGAETDYSNNNATCTMTIPIPNIDLWVTKTGPAEIQPGEIATYTVTYGNRGNATAENVKLSDQFPSQMDYVVRNEAGYILVRQVSTNHGTWSIPSVPPGTSTPFKLSIQIKGDASPGTVTNTMRIEYPGAETDYSNNNATCTMTIPIPNIDLWVTKTGPAEIQPGEIATYTVTYGNRGNATAENVKLSDQFPSQMDYVVRNEAGYILVRQVSSNHGTWSIPSVAPGTYTFALSIQIREDATPGTVINTMRIEYSGAETNSSNNNATCTITIPIPDIDLWVTKTGPSEVQPGEVATYTVSYGNRGNATAENVKLSDQFPPQMDYVVRNEAGYILVRQVSTNHGTWSIPSVAPGTYSFALSIRIKNNVSGSTTVINTMRIQYPGAETNYSNNNATATIHVTGPEIDLWVTKQASSEVSPGGTITYTISYGNRGNATAHGVKLTDQFPAEMTHVLNQASGYILIRQVVTNYGAWFIGDLPPGTRTFPMTIRMSEDISGSMTIVNRIDILCDDVESNLANNFAIASTHVAGNIDLWVTKVGPTSVLPGEIATYTISYGNRGDVDAMDVKLSDQFPSQMDYVVRNEAGYILVRQASTNHGTWSIPAVPPGTYTFKMSIRIREDASPGTVTNTMRIEYPGSELNYTNNYATATMQVATPDIDLWVTKELTSPTGGDVLPGEIATYTIRYGNKGNTTAEDVKLSDQFPSQMDYVVRNEAGYILVRQVSTNHGTWSIPAVPPGTYTFKMSIRIREDALPGTVTNTMRIEYPGLELNYTNNDATSTLKVATPNIDLWVTKELTSPTGRDVLPGEIATYTIRYGNKGNTTAEDVKLSDQFPSQMDYVVRNEAGYILVRQASTNHGTWSIPSVPPGTYTFKMSIRIREDASPGTVTNTMRIEYPGSELNYTNNDATSTLKVAPPNIDLWVTKELTSPTGRDVLPGEIATYTIRYGNKGNTTAEDVKLSDQFPSQMDYVVRNEAGYILVRQVSTNHGTWSIPSVPPGTYTFKMSIRIREDASPGTVTNTMRIEYPGSELNYANNDATSTLKIAPPNIDLWVTKELTSPIGGEVMPGEIATYTIRYGNKGNTTAEDVKLSDQFPSQMDYVVRNEAGYILVRQVSTNHGTWSIPSVPPGTYTFKMSIRIREDASPGTVTNTMRIEYPGSELNYTNNYATSTLKVATPNIDLWVTKTGPVEVQPGEIATYTIGYGNKGNITAMDVKLSDQFPPQMDYIVRNEAGYILVRQVSTNHGTWSIPAVPPGTYTFKLSIRIREDASPGTATNTMKIEYPGSELNYTNNYATATLKVATPNIDLWVTKELTSPTGGEVLPGEIATYTIRYGNKGNTTAEDVKLSDQFPSQMDYVVRNEAGYILVRQVSTNHGTWSIPSVAPGTYTFKMSIRIREDASPGTATNTMRIEYPGSELNYTNNNATATLKVAPPNIDLWVTKELTSPIGGDVLPGEIATYTIRYGNKGNTTAEDVKLSDQFPFQMDYVVRNEAGYILVRQVSTNHGTWTIGSLPPGGSYTFKLSIRIRPDAVASSTIINTMKIESSSDEINWANNYATATIHVGTPDVDLWVTKQGPAEVLPGEVATYTISYGNRGKVTAVDVKLSDQFPSQMDYVVRNEAGYILVRQVSTNHGTWSIPSVPPGTYTFKLSIRIRSDVIGSTTIINTIRIDYPGVESDYTNNQSTSTIHVSDTNLSVIKTGPRTAISKNTITYTIYYRNQGQTPAQDTILTEYLPRGLRYISDTNGYVPVITGSGTLASPQMIKWNLGEIAYSWWWNEMQVTALITDELPASPSLTANLNNVVEMTTISPETDYTNNRATCTTSVDKAMVDLQVSKSGPWQTVRGNKIAYQISFSNYSGNSLATGTVLTDYLPRGVEYATDTLGLGSPTITGSVTSGGQVVSWQIGTVATGWDGYKSFELTAFVGTQAASPINNRIAISSQSQENNYTNNRATVTTTVETPMVNLVIYKYGQKEINPGQATIKYWISYTNIGNVPAGSVTIKDSLPVPVSGSVKYESDTGGFGTPSIDGNQVSWFVGTVSSGYYSGKTFEMTVNVLDVPGSTTLTNLVTITSPHSEDNPANNAAYCTTFVKNPEVDLEIRKWGTNKALPGEMATYTIQYRNLGSVDAGSTTITEILPQGLEYVSDTSGATPTKTLVGTYTEVRWEFGTRAFTGSREGVLFDVHCRIATGTPPGSLLRNVATIHTISPEIRYDNNTDTCTTEVLKPEADLRITKSKSSPSYDVTPGCELTYRISYSNYGNIAATNIVITDTLPGSVSFVSCTGSGTLSSGKVTWQVGTVTKSRIGYYDLRVRVNPDVEGSSSLINVVEITSLTLESNKANNRATCTVRVVDYRADVAIYKSGPSQIASGKNMRYLIRYDNYNGNIAATNTCIIDTLPDGLTYSSDTSGLSLIIAGNTLQWQIGTLGARVSKSFYLDVLVGSDICGSTSITNRIEIKTNTEEKNLKNNIASWKTHITGPEVDLKAEKRGPDIAAPGQEITYRLTCRNLTQNIAEQVRIIDILPAGVSYVSDNSGIEPQIAGNQIIWEIGNLGARSEKRFNLNARIDSQMPASVTITNIVGVTTLTNETDYTNNQATWTTHLKVPKPDLVIYKWQTQKEVTAGQMMVYHIRAQNQDTGDAGNVVITDYLPAGVTYMSDDSGLTPGTQNNKVIWDCGTLSAGSNKYFKMTVLVDKAVPAFATLTNVVEITTPDAEPNMNNNRATCTTRALEPIADVLVYKFGPEEVLYGTDITYTINYSNNSSSEAEGVVITDTIDPQVSYVSDTCSGTQSISGNVLRWELGSLGAWSSGNFKLTVHVPGTVKASSTLTNLIEITTLTKENNQGNNRATCTTHVDVPKVDVLIRKWGDEARPGFGKTYHITYENKGTEKAEGVVIVDKLPPEVIYDGSTPAGDYNPGLHTVTWYVGDIEPQSVKDATIDVRIPRTQPCGVNLTNYIKITTLSVESDYTNNECIEIETVVTSIDPNDKLVSPQAFCQNNQLLSYTIHCENMATAGASAILISITDRLDPTVFDLTTFVPGEVGIGDKVYTLDNFDRGSLSYSFDSVSGTATWFFDFHKGANGLPPNVISPEGEGYVTFKVRAKQGLAAGTRIENKAGIIFDYNDPLDTPLVVNVVDRYSPISRVSPLASIQSSSSFVVSWSGTDTVDGTTPGSISTYSIYVSDNSGVYTCWLEDTTWTSGTWTGMTGHTYRFYSIAKDRAGYTEGTPTTADAATKVELPCRLALRPLETDMIYAGGSLSVSLAIYDKEDNPVTDYVGTISLSDKLGSIGTATFVGTGTWTGEVTIPQMPNGGTDTITVESPGIMPAVSDTFLVLINRYVGGTVTLFTPGVGTTTVRFGTGSFGENFYVIIRATSTIGINIPEGSIINSAREILAYNMSHSSLTGTFTNMAYLEIPYPDVDGNGVVDGTKINADSLKVWVYENNEWKEIAESGKAPGRNVVCCHIGHLTTFMPIGILLAPPTLGNVVVYPNPFKPNSGLGHEYITFGSKKDVSRKLTAYATIKIYTISGDLVKTLEVTPQDNGQKIWYSDNDAGKKVATGVYIYMITNPQGEKCIGKLAIIR